MQARVSPDCGPPALDQSLNRELLALCDEGDLSKFVDFVKEHCDDDFSTINATTALHRLAKWWSASGGKEVGDHTHTVRQGRLVSGTLEALAQLSHLLAGTFRRVALSRSGETRVTVLPRHLAITAWAFATLSRVRSLGIRGERLGGLFEPLTETALLQVACFDGQSLGNLLWGCAVLRQVCRRLFFLAAKRAIVLLRQGHLQGQNLSNVVWAFSFSRIPNQTLFNEVAMHDLWSSKEISSQHITNTLWAFSRIHGKIGIYRQLFEDSAAAAIPRLPGFKTQELANILWTFANQTMYHEGLFAAVALHARGRLSEFDNFDFSQLLWSFAKVWWRDLELFDEAARDLLSRGRYRSMCAQDLGCVLWAFAMVQWSDKALFAALANAARAQMHTLKPLDVGNIAWALGSSRQLDASTARSIADYVLQQDLSRPTSEGGGWGAAADGWVHILDALQGFRGELAEVWEQLKGRFERAILHPLCKQLGDMQQALPPGTGTGAGEEGEEYCEATQRAATATARASLDLRLLAIRQRFALLETWVNELQLEHLGPRYTQEVAETLGFGSGVDSDSAEAAEALGEALGEGGSGESRSESWVAAGRQALASYSAQDARQTASASVGSTAFRVGLHQSKVLAWLSYRLLAECPRGCLESIEEGLVVPYGRADRDYCPLWQAAERLLQPMVTTHSRGGHAERVALLLTLTAILRLLTGEERTAALAGRISGEVRLFVSHWPCISCLAVFSQFLALCPCVQLQVVWDGYVHHTEPHAPPENCQVWTSRPAEKGTGLETSPVAKYTAPRGTMSRPCESQSSSYYAAAGGRRSGAMASSQSFYC